MSRGTDYIPTNDGEFLTWVKNLFAYVMHRKVANLRIRLFYILLLR
jgi:hypothetical protein